MSAQRFADKVAVITGGASGLGAATATKLASEGAKIVILDINEELATTFAASLPEAIAIVTDVVDPESVKNAFDAAISTYGSVDVIFNNAGIDGKQQPLAEMDLENWQRVVRINGDGAFYVLKYGIQAMLATGGGSIVNTVSTVGLAAQENISPYTFTKAGLVGLTKSAAVEYAKSKIRVNAVAPTAVRTALVEHFIATAEDPQAMSDLMENFNPIPGMPDPEDVANAVAFLASDDARWITGHTLPIDGGYVAR